MRGGGISFIAARKSRFIGFLAAEVTILVFGIFLPPPLLAWDSRTHALITELALRNDPAVQAQVRVELLGEFLAKTEYQDVPGFLKALHLNPSVSFNFIIPGEKPGNWVTVLEVMKTYVTEPDAGMDQNICSSYPGYCNPDYEFMGAFAPGIVSQAFRHMYWPGKYLKTWSSHLPLPRCVHTPLG